MNPFTPPHMLAVAAVVAAWQVFLAVRFALRLRREARAAPSPFAPSVSMIVACKGEPRRFDENILGLLDQDYGGEREYVFVSPSASDPAYRRLQILLKSRPQARTKLLDSGAVPVRCSEKILNLLFALKSASPRSEVLVFADCDVRVAPDWLRSLLAPLARTDVIASSAPSLYAADALSPLQLLRMAWMGLVLCDMDFFGSIFGWSWAIRRADFESVGVARLWERSLTDDFVLNRPLKATGRRIAWALTAMPVCAENPTLNDVLTPFIKGFQYFRVYDAPLWIAGGLEALGKLYLAVWFWRSGMPLAAFSPAIADAAAVLVLCAATARWAPRAYESVHPLLRRLPALVALAAPFLLVLRVWVFLVSAVSTTVRWGGYVYEMRKADDVRVIGRF
jgi:hypothetical protein